MNKPTNENYWQQYLEIPVKPADLNKCSDIKVALTLGRSSRSLPMAKLDAMIAEFLQRRH
jgi:hypothetical protein